MDTTTIEYVFFEDAPYVTDSVLDEHGQLVQREELTDECASLPAEFRRALTGLLRKVDNARCDRCLDPAGFVLAEKANGFEYSEWVPTGLARHGDGPVAVLCEHCTPYLPESQED